MQDWTKVVVQPLGLAGFALFLVFGLVARIKRTDDRRWLSKAAFSMAFLALVGGLVLSYVKVRSAVTAPPFQVQSIQTTGAASPVIVNSGAVNYTANAPAPNTSSAGNPATGSTPTAGASPKPDAHGTPSDKKP